MRNGTLDALRILACVMVVAFHYGEHYGLTSGGLISLGGMGVPLFFMISGYVIIASLEGRGPGSFLWARWVRLWSTYLPSLLITAGVVSVGIASGYGGHLEEEMSFDQRDFLVSLTLLTHLAQLGMDVSPVDGAYWSLGVEIQFYLMIALWTRVMGRGKEHWFMLGWLTMSLLYAFRPFWIGEVVFALKWAPFFCLGMLFHRVSEKAAEDSPLGALGLVILSILTMEAVMLRGNHGPAYTVSMMGAVMVFILLMAVATLAPNLIRGKLVNYLALLTYPLYLIHQNVGYVVMNALKDDFNDPLRVCAAVAVSLGLSMIALSAGNLIAKGMKCINSKPGIESNTSAPPSA